MQELACWISVVQGQGRMLRELQRWCKALAKQALLALPGMKLLCFLNWFWLYWRRKFHVVFWLKGDNAFLWLKNNDNKRKSKKQIAEKSGRGSEDTARCSFLSDAKVNDICPLIPTWHYTGKSQMCWRSCVSLFSENMAIMASAH